MNNKYSILYVDDEPVNRKLFEMTVNKYCHVITADSGFNGLKILDEHPEILHVYTDFKMPGMNGMEFILAARKQNPNRTF
ncbi:MAG: response regulator, partial [Bacteroidales bacterium]|nr:response regulator [Bacteroidales bacterium]